MSDDEFLKSVETTAFHQMMIWLNAEDSLFSPYDSRLYDVTLRADEVLKLLDMISGKHRSEANELLGGFESLEKLWEITRKNKGEECAKILDKIADKIIDGMEPVEAVRLLRDQALIIRGK